MSWLRKVQIIHINWKKYHTRIFFLILNILLQKQETRRYCCILFLCKSKRCKTWNTVTFCSMFEFFSVFQTIRHKELYGQWLLSMILTRYLYSFLCVCIALFPLNERRKLYRCVSGKVNPFVFNINEEVKFVLQLNCFVLARSLGACRSKLLSRYKTNLIYCNNMNANSLSFLIVAFSMLHDCRLWNSILAHVNIASELFVCNLISLN